MILASNMLNQSQLPAKLSENIGIMILQTVQINTTMQQLFRTVCCHFYLPFAGAPVQKTLKRCRHSLRSNVVAPAAEQQLKLLNLLIKADGYAQF